jgi:hypothetical protein
MKDVKEAGRKSFLFLLRQRDNFPFGQRDYFRFLEVQSFLQRKEDDFLAEGTNHVDQAGT